MKNKICCFCHHYVGWLVELVHLYLVLSIGIIRHSRQRSLLPLQCKKLCGEALLELRGRRLWLQQDAEEDCDKEIEKVKAVVMAEAADSVHEEEDGGVGCVGDSKDDGGDYHPKGHQTRNHLISR